MAIASDAIRIDGLVEFQASLRKMDGQSQKMLRVVFNQSAELVVTAARDRTPVRTGRLKGSIRASSQQRSASVSMGSAKVPYAGFIDYGGRVGIKRSVVRPFVKAGRIMYPGYEAVRPQVLAYMSKGLADLAVDSGLGVT